MFNSLAEDAKAARARNADWITQNVGRLGLSGKPPKDGDEDGS